ncbi:MAG: peptidoglycan DD-metalloendopeptidase family protein, partial [Angelakisella sp.]
ESGNLADDIKERMTGRLLKSKDGLLKLFTEPRRSNAEIEEDKTKFGGLDDEEVEQDDEQDETEPPELLKKLRNLRGTPQDPPASEHPSGSPVQPAKAEKSRAAGITHKIEKTNPVYPIMRYAYETYGWGYTECYYIGIQVLRNCADLRRRLFTMGVWARYNIPHFIRVKRHQIARVLDGITDSCLHPFRDIVTKSRSMRIAISRILRQQEEGKAKASGRVFLKYLYSLGKPINSIASFILPILGCAVLAAVILYFQQISYALEVEYSGVKLGYIAREGDFYEAKNKVYARLINEEYAPADDSRPSFRLVITDEENLLSTEALANKIMTVSKNEVAMADGIYIDGAFLGAVEDGSEFLFYIDSILDNYRTNTAHERVQFVKKVALQRGMYPISSIRPVHEIKNALENNESLPQSHKVEKGETLETIAEKNNTTVKAIIGLNPTLAARSEEDGGDVPVVFAGEEILVNKVELSLGIQVTRRETYTEEIDFGVDYKDDNKQLDSYVVTLSNGIKGEREIISDVTYIDGERVNETVIERNVVKEPVNAKKVRGTLKPAEFLPAGSGDTNASFIWPVAGGYVSAGLYGYRGHTGMDIAAPYGTGIYAARSGTVTYASNKNIWPYGRRVNINHGDGVTSLYAHCSEVLVQPGQYVKQGQLIAKIGRTGNASGNHLHIEIKINGRIMNPADFIGKG